MGGRALLGPEEEGPSPVTGSLLAFHSLSKLGKGTLFRN